MSDIKDETVKRKAEEDLPSPAAPKRVKHSDSEEPQDDRLEDNDDQQLDVSISAPAGGDTGGDEGDGDEAEADDEEGGDTKDDEREEREDDKDGDGDDEDKDEEKDEDRKAKIEDGDEPNSEDQSPGVIEERNGEIEFRVVNNDGGRESLIVLTGLKCLFQKQLPKMPKDYIARLVYDRTHLSIAIVKKPLEVVGGVTFRPFKGRRFAEIVFFAISTDQQVKGYGAHLMCHLKDYVKATSDVMYFLTYADNYAIGYFKKQGFTKEITLDRSVWMGYIKDYEGGTIMQCSMLPRIRYLEVGRLLLKQKECVQAKIRAYSKSHNVHAPPKEWKNGIKEINPLDIPAIRASGWSPDMDELARQPRHGPNYNQLLHLLNDLQNHNSAWPFLVPVNRDDVADYYEVIKEPMDLSTMENKLEADQYPTPEEFIRDATLVFNNCRKYNNESTPYAKSATKLEKFMWQQLKAVPEWSHLEPEK
ncbi:histone acetyltransferase GCN5 [Akanthomyces lecanii RCEF 1005]|uniref:histone acetyltransferase n=1 Tax=Akanthomyces lecanii RCEF 1005 TaxID=1081108 RepID=A0A168JYG4_CORDF|nr:histone acetyltransferase GCN5 [Akanthomyces lecanii RCEF 1005]